MAGSIEANAMIYKKQAYVYKPAASPSELIDCTHFVIDFSNRKFLNVGLDPTDDFDVKIIILTPSRHVVIPHSFLKRIYSLMGHILSFVLDTPDKSKKITFLEDEFTLVTNMVYRGENMMVIESKTEDGCRVLLNRSDLLALQELEHCVHEAVTEKSTITRSTVIHQFNQICERVEKKCKLPTSIHTMKTFANGLNYINEPGSFKKQIGLLACQQIVDRVRSLSEPKVNYFIIF